MITTGELSALEQALTAAQARVTEIERAYAKWRNAFSYVGWEDAATEHARTLTEAARSAMADLMRDYSALMESPFADHEAARALLERARHLAASEAAAVIEREGRGSNIGAIVGGVAVDVGTNTGAAAAGVLEGTGDALGGALGGAGKLLARIPWWAWAAGAAVALVALAPTVNTVALAARRGRR